MSDPAAIADERVATLAREILERRAYARFRPVDEAWLRDFFDWLGRLFDGFQGLSVSAPWLYAAILLGLVAVAALLLAHVALSLRAALRAGEPAPRATSAAPPALDREAAALAAADRLLEAAHVMQLACLHALIDGGAIELRRHDANPVLRDRVARAALPDRERGDFLALLDQLETRWFRDRAPREGDRALFEAWTALHARLVSLGPA